VVLHALCKDAGERYPTAAALEAAIDRALANPEDAEGVRPPARVKIDEDAAAHAETIPAPMPSDKPPPATSVRPARRSSEMPALDKPSRGWTVVWILAALIGISIGVWLSLR
jgi:hypothetical protein